MQLNPLQSRFMASVVASFLLLLLYLVLFPPSFALAAELARDVPLEPGSPSYNPAFSLLDKSILGRQDDNTVVLVENTEEAFEITPGQTRSFLFDVNSAVARRSDIDEGVSELKKRQAPTKVCLSACMCRRPDNTDSATETTVQAPQLTMFVSTDAANTSPGPDAPADQQDIFVFGSGLINQEFEIADLPDSNIQFSISSPGLLESFEGTYVFDVVASTDSCFYQFQTYEGNITWVDTDDAGAILVVDDIPIGENEEPLPFVLFVQRRETDFRVTPSISSFCGLQNYAEVQANTENNDDTAATRLVRRQDEPEGSGIQQRFFLDSLEENNFYWGILAQDRRQQATDPGITVFRATNFTTDSAGGTCDLMFDLDFCSDVAYPVPGNRDRFPTTESLKAWYDNYTRSHWESFEKALMQTPCEAPMDQQYSLVRTCDDCKEAYKSWLCSVAVPYCNEVTDDRDYLIPRNFRSDFTNGTVLSPELLEAARAINAENLTSRNSFLDAQIAPGPYKELLPCDVQCYNLVQSCPASLGFSCPRPNMVGFNASYREQSRGSDGCNGGIPGLSGGGALAARIDLLAGILMGVGILLLV